MLDLQTYTHNGLTLITRDSHTDRGVFIEAEDDRYYFWNSLSGIERAMDIGAHVGSWSKWVKFHYPDAGIIAVELERDNYRVACVNLAPLDGVFVYHARLGYDQNGAWFGHHIDTGSHHIISKSTPVFGVNPQDVTVEPLRVPTFGLETLMDMHRWEYADVVKLDCEGTEIDILLNAPDSTLRRVRAFVGERHQPIDEFRRLVGERLESLFDVEYRDHPTAPHLGFFLARLK